MFRPIECEEPNAGDGRLAPDRVSRLGRDRPTSTDAFKRTDRRSKTGRRSFASDRHQYQLRRM